MERIGAGQTGNQQLDSDYQLVLIQQKRREIRYYVYPKHIKIMRRLPSSSRVETYITGSKQVRQGGGHDKPSKSDLSSSWLLYKSKILLRMQVPTAGMVTFWVKQNKIKMHVNF